MLWLALTALAQAGVTYSANLEIVGEEPKDFSAIDPRMFRGSLFYARGQPDLDVRADWPYLRCSVEDERVYVTFLATQGDWPERFPERAVCTAGDFKLVLALRPRPAEWGQGPTKVQPVTEVALHLPDAATGHPVSAVQTFLLPSGTYVEESVQATTRVGEDWPGVYCRAGVERRASWVQVLVSDDAPAGAGACALPRRRDTNFVLPITFTR